MGPVEPVVEQSQVMPPARSGVQELPLHASLAQGSKINNIDNNEEGNYC